MAEAGGGNYPPFNFPCVFADGVSSLSYSKSVVKFFLCRFEPELGGTPGSKLTPMAQVVMPMEAFIATLAFFEIRLEALKAAGLVTQSQLDEARRTARGETAIAGSA